MCCGLGEGRTGDGFMYLQSLSPACLLGMRFTGANTDAIKNVICLAVVVSGMKKPISI